MIDKTKLHIDFQEDITVVSSTLQMRRSPNLVSAQPALISNGVDIKLWSLAINDKALDESQYALDGVAEQVTETLITKESGDQLENTRVNL